MVERRGSTGRSAVFLCIFGERGIATSVLSGRLGGDEGYLFFSRLAIGDSVLLSSFRACFSGGMGHLGGKECGHLAFEAFVFVFLRSGGR